MHDDLLTRLALLGPLRVTARTSVTDYRNTPKTARQIGEELGVASLVEGSVQRAGNRIRVSARLVDAKSATPLWTKSYDRDLKDLFAIEAELATGIATSLKAPDASRLAKEPSRNLAAYDFYLREQQLGDRALLQRIELLSEAVSFDPSFALAWARLASLQSRAHPARAKQAFERAQALAPGDLRVKLESGSYYADALQDLPRAAKAFEEVLDAAPGSVDALLGLARVRGLELRWDERAALLERTLALDPRNLRTLADLSWQYREFRRWDLAVARLRQAADLRPDEPAVHADLAWVEYLRTGSWAAFDEWRRRLPAGIDACCGLVRDVDIARALARRDLAAAARLADVDTADSNTATEAQRLCREVERVLILRAAADARAAQAVQEALHKVDKVVVHDRDVAGLGCKAQLQAATGQRLTALFTLATELKRASGNGLLITLAERDRARMHALLGERKEALAALKALLPLPGTSGYALLTDIALASLWDDAEFQRLAGHPASNEAVSYDIKYALK